MEALKQKIKDRSLLNLIGRMLKAGVVEEGMYIEAEEGTPQGSVLSPVLAKVWVISNIDKQLKTFIEI